MKLFLDECISRKLKRELTDFLESSEKDLKIEHLFDRFASGTPDTEWIELLSREKDWLVITADNASKSSQSPLPTICEKLGVTHILIKPAIRNGGYSTMKLAIASVCSQFESLGRLPAGTQIRLGYLQHRGELTTFCLRVKGKLVSSILSKP